MRKFFLWRKWSLFFPLSIWILHPRGTYLCPLEQHCSIITVKLTTKLCPQLCLSSELFSCQVLRRHSVLLLVGNWIALYLTPVISIKSIIFFQHLLLPVHLWVYSMTKKWWSLSSFVLLLFLKDLFYLFRNTAICVE